MRKLTVGTILGHFTKLVQDKAVDVKDIFPADKLETLAELFKFYKEESLNPMKEQVGDRFSWDDGRCCG